ncbi:MULTISPECIES: phosphatidate cytidylyltransferase [Methylorubrum]|jgi:phosphatidate cytidylyltransferase|uniref:Phosphatidate cytidylyltransferase n=2 Tax=Methylorubrum extorquens TaxID=408 RepID=C5B2L5_METEA|nr:MULTISPECIES: phosphatidate cytidylyltransferase [Methylorubrum]ACS39870.1 CDP-diglyceride synthase [Methylorubrum extorquens AM1]EHP93863.1 phosphatidate cytidylyltransferase [Methylorubrum extorquens DSM 13060]MCP1541987.1 phosphatidate cytidylyltransferase [Methylorubrum extorquens]MCP1585476.1 phosphatidate cytidylyltransferase [Methylorubrum extorquens]BDL39473.1 phosphatidate cytidylyltransferase [Methylorubrum sp. GM97]
MAGDEVVSPARRPPFANREFGLRVASALVLGAVVLGTLLVGGWAFAGIWLIAGVVGAAEWLAMTRSEPLLPLLGLTGATLFGVLATALLGAPVWVPVLLLLAGSLGLFALGHGPGRRKPIWGLLGGAVVALVPTLLRIDPEIGIVGPAWMFAVVWSTDSVAYFTGRLIGGPKLMPRVSPKKTWSGALGGLAAGIVGGTVTVLIARSQGWDALPAVSLPLVAALSGLASILSQGGDLVESALKRRYGVKDSGRSIPGHGGVMDRLDGFFAVAGLAGLCLAALRLLNA